ncbi:hypothetical protein BFW86_01780 [Pseudomonas fluorescens]|nr:hypothetical protein BFW86_01780 [Pseudomonas fluorescens]
MKRCNRVQPFLCMKFSTFIRKKFPASRIRFALVRLLLRSAVLAPKRSKNTAFGRIHIRVQLIRKKQVAPYLLC